MRSGTAKVLVVRTGKDDRVLDASPEGCPIRPVKPISNAAFTEFGYLLTRIMTIIVLFVLTVNLLLQRPLIDSLLFAVALAVGLTPELLPAIVSVTLSAGARQMAKRGVIVRRLEAIENLGSVDILCTDKTGTLTKGVVELDRGGGRRRRRRPSGSSPVPPSMHVWRPASKIRSTRPSWRPQQASGRRPMPV